MIAACAAGCCARCGRDRKVFTAPIVGVIASAIILVAGLLWLGDLYGWNKVIVARGSALREVGGI